MIPGKDYIGVGCGLLVVNKKDEVLLMLRNAKIRNDKNLWSQPGGAVEFGETIEQAIKREAREEIGVEVELMQLLNVNDHLIDGAHWIAPACLCRITSGEPKNMEPEKCAELRWFPLDALPKNLNKNTKNSIQALQRFGKSIS